MPGWSCCLTCDGYDLNNKCDKTQRFQLFRIASVKGNYYFDEKKSTIRKLHTWEGESCMNQNLQNEGIFRILSESEFSEWESQIPI